MTERRKRKDDRHPGEHLNLAKVHMRNIRALETPESHAARLLSLREHAREVRTNEDPQTERSRLLYLREHAREVRTNEDPETERSRLLYLREHAREVRTNEDPETEGSRLLYLREHATAVRSSEDTDSHTRRVQQIIEHRRNIREIIGIATVDNRPNLNYFGKMEIPCKQCGALHFQAESNNNGSYNSCCNYGHVVVHTASEHYPSLFRNLLTSNDEISKNFRENIRNYNSSLALASMGAKLATPSGRGPYCYKIHGQVYHNIGPLHPDGSNKPSYGQLYIMDTDMATAERMNNPANINCDSDLMRTLGQYMLENNPFARAYKMMYEVEEMEIYNAITYGRKINQVSMIFKDPTYKERHTYNTPISNEVALIFVGDEVPEKRSIAIHSRANTLSTLLDTDEKCDPMVYPIFYPNGARGRTRLTQREYYAYLIHVRHSFFPLQYGGKLFQQWIVDSWARTEQNRLHYLRTHQSDLRVDTYKTITDFLASDDNEAGRIGMKVVLPSTFQSGPRGMHQNYQDAMSIVARFGKPDYFITFTCNSKWKEITEQLFNNDQAASDRPDLIARVFEMKIKSLLHDLMISKVLGEVAAYVYVIEFQKRGIPHCHMLLTMKSSWKPRNSSDVDRFICAELPDELTDARLHTLVATLMIHRPCGSYNPNSPCMREGKCTKRYPKEFSIVTKMDTNGYPEYRRLNNQRSIFLKDFEVNNRWVVPFSPYFLLKYEAHINIEVCALIAVVMYLFKYVYKGEDRARIELKERDESNDEISRYINARYLCSPEGVHRLLGYTMQGKSHHIERLDLHLPNEQRVEFEVGKELEALENRRITKLTAFFELNQMSESIFDRGMTGSSLTVDSRNFLYSEIPEHFVWDRKAWKERKREGINTIGRMFTVSPKDKEWFSIRILLLNRKGPKSFEDLRTVNGAILPTFTDAAKELGLLKDDAHYIQCMEEAARYKMPVQLRRLFCCLICFTELHEPQIIWDKFKNELADDFTYHGHSIDESCVLAYYDISDRVAVQNILLSELITIPGIRSDTVGDSINYDHHTKKGREMYRQLNVDQKLIIDSIFEPINIDTHRLFYVDGPGGSGKTFAYNCIYNLMMGGNIKVMNVCWTGIAANLLHKGRTVCSAFKLDIKNNCNRSTMKAQTMAAKIIANTDVFIWDEAPMAPKSALEAIDVLLQDIMQNNQPFGGKIFILGGDFRQVLPIVEHACEDEMIQASIKKSHLWRKFRQFSLIQNLRLIDTESNMWAKTLLDIGNGSYPTDESKEIVLDDQLYVQSETNLIDAVFGDIKDLTSEVLAQRTILAPKNVDVFEINDEILSKMDGEVKEYKSIDELHSDSNQDEMIQNFPTEFLNNMTPTGMAPHILKLKKGALVMLLRNIDVEGGLVNGCRLIIEEMGKHILSCKIAAGVKKGETVLIPKIELHYDRGIPFILKRKQFPLRLCFAMTINKSQGQSFERVGLNLTEQVFGHGQLYVALSRCTTKKGIIIKSNTRKIRNVVLTEILK